MASGRILLRISEHLHRDLQSQAAASDRSVNELCAIRLELPSFLEQLPAEVPEAIQLAKKISGKYLIGIVIFGSWAKGTQRDESDVDLLVVLDPRRPITRSIYSKWQDGADSFERCEPHFVNLPIDHAHISSLWAEVALDGVVLFDVEQKLKQHLGKIRRWLVEGKLIAKKIHGQVYWVREEVV